MERLGIFGGTFDPPHQGHLILAEAAYRQLQLDQVLWAPAGQPPHKSIRPSGTDAAPLPSAAHHRLAMTELAIMDRPHFALCHRDLERPGPHYTADLLALLKAEYGSQVAFWFLVGKDSLRDLASWHAPEKILALCRLGVYPRPGLPVDWDTLETIVPDIRNKTDWLSGPPIELASTQIREQIRQGIPVITIPRAVYNYIKKHSLYLP